MSDITDDIINFKNPTGFWDYSGDYVIDLVPGTDKSSVPSSATICGEAVEVTSGLIGQAIGAIEFWSQGQYFRFCPSKIKWIRKINGELLWINDDYRSK